MSGSIFSIAIDPVLRRLVALQFASPVKFDAYADDIAAVIRNVMVDLPPIIGIFEKVELATALVLKKKKCVIVPLDMTFSLEHHSRKIFALIPGLRGAPFRFHAKYLGATIGPLAHKCRWKVQADKLIDRARWIKGQCGTSATRMIEAYKSHAFSVMMFVAQFYPPDVTALTAERRALHTVLSSPYNAWTVNLACNLDLGGVRRPPPNIREHAV